jgi:hypothetical protein
VPASWTDGGFTRLYTEECPDVRFNDWKILVSITAPDVLLPIDPHYSEVCEQDTPACIGSTDLPVLHGEVVEGSNVRVRIPAASPTNPVRFTVLLTALRRGFPSEKSRWPDSAQADFDAVEHFLQGQFSHGRK